ncbi:hypothetical protein FF125_09435 [Aureibaculum algae]|uniref:Uncharacterized protein n=1 Tax=Aureibaculum algae TaxID=2584122 RepID=A0A5B7TVG9_9FLAO|nr:hypothetical protein [Aureibaculum algae]QCX38642.1 hypothetical protein FF125_09435 [Aureibaculum algae]
MNRTLILLFLLIYNFSIGQTSNVTNKQLSKQEIESTFTENIRKQLKIDNSIYRIYEYNDKIGKHFVIMTQNKIDCEQRKECFDSIKVFCYLFQNKTYKMEWKLKDFIVPNSYEYSISHWTKYFSLDDYDKDGIADPIIIYGTFGMNDTGDGRIKIVIYYKGNKRVIRHQNGILDDERHTQVDKEFYKLPIEIQSNVKTIMKNININGHGIFPSGWEKAMKNKELKIIEN